MYGRDFVVDLLGLLDLLWPVVLLMQEGQAQWCPGWKIVRHVPKVKEEINNMINEFGTENPSPTICPRLGAHFEKVKNFKDRNSDLVDR